MVSRCVKSFLQNIFRWKFLQHIFFVCFLILIFCQFRLVWLWGWTDGWHHCRFISDFCGTSKGQKVNFNTIKRWKDLRDKLDSSLNVWRSYNRHFSFLNQFKIVDCWMPGSKLNTGSVNLELAQYIHTGSYARKITHTQRPIVHSLRQRFLYIFL